MEPPATLRFAVSSVYHSPHEEGAVIQFSIGLHTLHAVRPPAVRWVRRYLSILRGITFADRTRSGFLSAVIASLGFAVLVFRSRPLRRPLPAALSMGSRPFPTAIHQSARHPRSPHWEHPWDAVPDSLSRSRAAAGSTGVRDRTRPRDKAHWRGHLRDVSTSR